MSEEILLQQIMNELKDVKNTMMTKEDMMDMATKSDIHRLDDHIHKLEDDILRLDDKMEKHSEKISIHLKRIPAITEQLGELSASVKQHDQTLGVLALRSVEQEGKLRDL